MARILSALMLIVILVGSFGPDRTSAAAIRICIDPGHGGSDPGTSNGAFLEKSLNLEVGLRLRDELLARGYLVTMTRTGDVGLGNSDRARICNTAAANALISIHHNGSTNAAVDYSVALYQKKVDRAFATAIVNATWPMSGTNRGLLQFASGVLIMANMPATISEAYFLTNATQRARLGTDYSGTCSDEAVRLANGIDAYFGR